MPLLAAGAVLLAGCGGGGVHVAVPAPTGKVATECRALIAAIPDPLLPGLPRRKTAPVSPYTAAFGSPAVTVRCGGTLPAHDPMAEVPTVDGVGWLLRPPEHDAEHYVSFDTTTTVETVIPHSAHYLPADVLAVLSPLVARNGVGPLSDPPPA